MEEFLVPGHLPLVQEKLRLFQEKEQGDTQLWKEDEDLPVRQLIPIGDQHSREHLPTAAIIWQKLLPRAQDKERIYVMTQLFRVQLEMGPWSSALETAHALFREITTGI